MVRSTGTAHEPGSSGTSHRDCLTRGWSASASGVPAAQLHRGYGQCRHHPADQDHQLGPGAERAGRVDALSKDSRRCSPASGSPSCRSGRAAPGWRCPGDRPVLGHGAPARAEGAAQLHHRRGRVEAIAQRGEGPAQLLQRRLAGGVGVHRRKRRVRARAQAAGVEGLAGHPPPWQPRSPCGSAGRRSRRGRWPTRREPARLVRRRGQGWRRHRSRRGARGPPLSECLRLVRFTGAHPDLLSGEGVPAAAPRPPGPVCCWLPQQ